MEEPEANSEAEAAYESLEEELLVVIGAALLATAAFDAATLNRKAQEVQRKVISTLAANKAKLDSAALNDLVGMYVLDALGDAKGSGLAVSEFLEDADAAAYSAYGRYLNDARYMTQGITDNARQQYLQAAREAARNVDRYGEKAIHEAVAKLAQKGITAYTYTHKDGVVVHVPVDVGIRRAMQSNDNLVSRGENTLNVAAKTSGLVEVSKTTGARASHAKWQGKVYQLDGSSSRYRNFYEACKWGDRVDGIGGYNCGHRFRVYYPSMGRQFSDPLKGTGYTNAEARELKSRQRALENDLRKLKRERETLKNLGLDTKAVNGRIRAKNAQLKDLIGENSAILKREAWRETIHEKARRRLDAYGKVHLDEKAKQRVRAAGMPIEKAAEDIAIGRSLGAAVFRDSVRLPNGSTTKISEWTRITGVKVIAGDGVARKIDEVARLVSQYGGSKEDWLKKRGNGYVDDLGMSRPCELHWYEERSVGRVEMKVKKFYY